MSDIVSGASTYHRDHKLDSKVNCDMQVDKAPDSAKGTSYSDATTNTSFASIEHSTTIYFDATTNTSFAELEDSADQFRAEQLYDFINAANKYARENPTAECLVNIFRPDPDISDHPDPFNFRATILTLLNSTESQIDIVSVLAKTKDLLSAIYDCRKALLDVLGEVAVACDWLELYADIRYNLCDLDETPAAIEDAIAFGKEEGFAFGREGKTPRNYVVKFRQFIRLLRRVYGEGSFCANCRILI